MRLPEPPPTIDTLINDGKEADLKLILSYRQGPLDHRGKYQHWAKVKYQQPPEGFTPKLYWLAMKQARLQISKELPFKDKHGKPFVFCMPDSLVEHVLWIAKYSAGNQATASKEDNYDQRAAHLKNSLIEEAIRSSQVEGAATTRKVAKDMIREGRRPADHSERMILNNHNAMAFIRELKGEDLTPAIVFKLHEIITEGTLFGEDECMEGKFRRSSDDIRVYSKDDVLLHTPPKSGELEQRLKLVCDFANEESEDDGSYIPLVIKGIIIHFMIGYDHPFVDGNGRTARALFYWMMIKSENSLLEYVSISRVLKKAPEQYKQAYLDSETDGNDTTYFLYHQLKAIRQATNELYEYLGVKAKKSKLIESLVSNSSFNGRLNVRQLEVLQHGIDNPGAIFTIKGHMNTHGVVYQTARTDLMGLSDDYPLLKKYKEGRTDMFMAPQNLSDALEALG